MPGRKLFVFALLQRNIANEHIPSFIEVPGFGKDHTLFIECFDDEITILPTGNALCLNWAHGDRSIFAKRVLLYNRAIETDENTIASLDYLQRLARLEKDMRRRS